MRKKTKQKTNKPEKIESWSFLESETKPKADKVESDKLGHCLEVVLLEELGDGVVEHPELACVRLRGQAVLVVTQDRAVQGDVPEEGADGGGRANSREIPAGLAE